MVSISTHSAARVVVFVFSLPDTYLPPSACPPSSTSSLSTHLPRFSLISPPMRSCALNLFPSRCSPTLAASCDLCHPFVFIWEQNVSSSPSLLLLNSPCQALGHTLPSSPPLPSHPPAAQPAHLAVCLSVLLRGTQREWNFSHFSSPCFVGFFGRGFILTPQFSPVCVSLPVPLSLLPDAKVNMVCCEVQMKFKPRRRKHMCSARSRAWWHLHFLHFLTNTNLTFYKTEIN